MESKFIDLELKVLTVIQFDFNYDYATPALFIQDFLHTHFKNLNRDVLQLSDQEINIFGKHVYSNFDVKLNTLTRNILYQNGSDLCVFIPPEILAASCILLANIKCAKDEELTVKLEAYNMSNFLMIENFDFKIFSIEFR